MSYYPKIGESTFRNFAARASSEATKAALKGVPAIHRHDGAVKLVEADGSLWRFAASSSAADASENIVLTPDAGSGRWLRLPGAIALVLPITFETADAAVLFTVPTGAEFKLDAMAWNITTSFTGGSSAAIGVSSGTLSGYTTKGDLIGGASGDVLATLVSTGAKYKAGTIGPKMDSLAEINAAYLVATDTIRFDRITDAFTAGAGNVIAVGRLIANAGA